MTSGPAQPQTEGARPMSAKTMTHGAAITAFIEADRAATRRDPPRYTPTEMKRFERAFKALALPLEDENAIRRLMELDETK